MGHEERVEAGLSKIIVDLRAKVARLEEARKCCCKDLGVDRGCPVKAELLQLLRECGSWLEVAATAVDDEEDAAVLASVAQRTENALAVYS